MSTTGKRPREDDEDQGGDLKRQKDEEGGKRARKSRWGDKADATETAVAVAATIIGGGAVAGAPDAASASSAILAARAKIAEKKAALEKKQLETRKEAMAAQVAEKLKQIQAGTLFQGPAAVAAAAGAASGVKPVVSNKFNERLLAEQAAKAQGDKAAAAAAAEEAMYYDPSLPTRKAERTRRSTFQFIEPGKYVAQGEEMRQHAFLSSMGISRDAMKSESVLANLALLAGSSNMVPLGLRAAASAPTLYEADKVPAVEWWDKVVLSGAAYSEEPKVKASAITNLIEHPVPIDPPLDATDAHLKPLMLTKREQRKLKRQRRVAEQKEKQVKIRLGLIKPPEPKYKLSNVMRTLGIEATAEPTAIEMMVRKHEEARLAKHLADNAAQALTKEQKAEKREAKASEDLAKGVRACVYRVEDLSHKAWKYKVRINAEQHGLVGAAVALDTFSVVIVEGGKTALHKYKKLMLQRIKWSETPENRGAAAAADADADAEADEGEGGNGNRCTLVWEGDIKRAHFKGFTFERTGTAVGARVYLEQKGCPEYFDLAKSFILPDL